MYIKQFVGKNKKTTVLELVDSSYKSKLINKNLYFEYRLKLKGDFYLPMNFLNLKFMSQFATVESIPFIIEKHVGNVYDLVARFQIDVSNSKVFNKSENQKFIYSFIPTIDMTLYNQLLKEVSQSLLDWFGHIYCHMSKYFLISYYATYQLSDLALMYTDPKYTGQKLKILPSDYFPKFALNTASPPRFYFEPIMKNKLTKFQKINELYMSNISGNIFDVFDKVTVEINYKTNKWNKLLIENKKGSFDSHSTNLNFGLKTLYDYEKQELVLSDYGVEGIYFPVQTVGEVKLNLVYSNVSYTGSFPINFTEELLPRTLLLNKFSIVRTK